MIFTDIVDKFRNHSVLVLVLCIDNSSLEPVNIVGIYSTDFYIKPRCNLNIGNRE